MIEDLQKLVEIECDEEKLKLSSKDYPFSLSLRVSSFENETEYTRFARNCEKLVRSSLEYKQWKDYIRDVLQQNACDVTHETVGEVEVQIHHHIPTLFQIVKAIINKKVASEQSFSTFDICLEVIEVHYKNWVGYSCLVTTIHEKITNGYLSLPVELVHGNYRAFLEQYGQYLDTSDLEEINEKLSVSLKTMPREQIVEWSKDNYPGFKFREATI